MCALLQSAHTLTCRHGPVFVHVFTNMKTVCGLGGVASCRLLSCGYNKLLNFRPGKSCLDAFIIYHLVSVERLLVLLFITCVAEALLSFFSVCVCVCDVGRVSRNKTFHLHCSFVFVLCNIVWICKHLQLNDTQGEPFFSPLNKEAVTIF